MQDMSGKNTLSDLKKEIMDQITEVNGFANIPFEVGLYKKEKYRNNGEYAAIPPSQKVIECACEALAAYILYKL